MRRACARRALSRTCRARWKRSSSCVRSSSPSARSSEDCTTAWRRLERPDPALQAADPARSSARCPSEHALGALAAPDLALRRPRSGAGPPRASAGSSARRSSRAEARAHTSEGEGAERRGSCRRRTRRPRLWSSAVTVQRLQRGLRGELTGSRLCGGATGAAMRQIRPRGRSSPPVVPPLPRLSREFGRRRGYQRGAPYRPFSPFDKIHLHGTHLPRWSAATPGSRPGCC